MERLYFFIGYAICLGILIFENGSSKLFFSLWIIASITLSLGLIVGDLCLKMVCQSFSSPYG